MSRDAVDGVLHTSTNYPSGSVSSHVGMRTAVAGLA